MIPYNFQRMRNYEQGLLLAEDLLDFLHKNANQITQQERNKWEPDFIGFKLQMLDYLNYWRDYIAYFNEVRKSTRFFCEYSSDAAAAQERFGTYLLGYENGRFMVHFLYLHDHRYQIICRKYQRQIHGKSTAHLCRHQQELLSDEEVERRNEEVIDRTVLAILEYLWRNPGHESEMDGWMTVMLPRFFQEAFGPLYPFLQTD